MISPLLHCKHQKAKNKRLLDSVEAAGKCNKNPEKSRLTLPDSDTSDAWSDDDGEAAGKGNNPKKSELTLPDSGPSDASSDDDKDPPQEPSNDDREGGHCSDSDESDDSVKFIGFVDGTNGTPPSERGSEVLGVKTNSSVKELRTKLETRIQSRDLELKRQSKLHEMEKQRLEAQYKEEAERRDKKEKEMMEELAKLTAVTKELSQRQSQQQKEQKMQRQNLRYISKVNAKENEEDKNQEDERLATLAKTIVKKKKDRAKPKPGKTGGDKVRHNSGFLVFF